MAFPQDIHVTNGVPDVGTGTVKTIDGLIATGVPVTSLPAITGTVTANQGSPPWSVSQSGTWNITTVTTVTTVAAVTSITNPVAATQSGTWNVRNLGNAGGIFDAIIGAGTAPANMVVAGGVFSSSPITLTNGQSSANQFDANGFLKVNIAAGAAAGGTSSTFGASFPATGTAIGAKTTTTGFMTELHVTPASTPAVAGDPALVVTLSPNGEVLDDAVDSGTGNKIAAKAAAGLVSQALVSAAGDRIDLAGGVDRALYVRPNCGLEDLTSGIISTALTTTTSTTCVPSAGAGNKNYVTSISVSNISATATELLIQDGSGGATKWILPVPASSGVVQNFPTPLGGFTAATAIFVAATVAASLKVSINGFKSKI